MKNLKVTIKFVTLGFFLFFHGYNGAKKFVNLFVVHFTKKYVVLKI